MKSSFVTFAFAVSLDVADVFGSDVVVGFFPFITRKLIENNGFFGTLGFCYLAVDITEQPFVLGFEIIVYLDMDSAPVSGNFFSHPRKQVLDMIKRLSVHPDQDFRIGSLDMRLINVSAFILTLKSDHFE